ncbi:GNAT family N-acetyltransferase [Bosea vaviloviae]|uniref:GNAT family N-acetyltransferase n=1 Tax=Bosea vaviloviae TaxID=1526658 RepID=A0A1D7U7V5_9HYPH|nr:GNAT family N-acetyltransferase [Bosea vaviloviae]AOO83419.1 GNAT family N-acetyltransferase [Bosea vaviloviae]
MTASFVIQSLAPEHDRLAFSCGVDALDRYLQNQASQDVRRHISNCFVASPVESAAIAGYYMLAAASVPVLDLPEAETKRLPRYPVLPTALIGRLAVDRQYRRRNLGGALLFDAIQRAARAEPAVFAMIVDAKDEDAAAFYQHFGFMPFANRPMSLFLPVATAMKLLKI